MMKRPNLYILVLAIFSSWITLAQAQVALPHLDPNFPVLMPAALGWRTQSRANASVSLQEDEREATEKIVNRSTERLGKQVSLSFVTKSFSFEGTLDQMDSESTHPNGTDEYKEQKIDVALAYSLVPTFKLGAGLNYLNQTVDTSTYYNKNMGAQVGFSYELWRFLYLAGAGALVSNTQENTVKNSWLERTLAFGLKFSKDFGPQLEASWTHSPRRKLKRSGSSQVNHHPETDVFRLSFEMKFLLPIIHVDYSLYSDKKSSSFDTEHEQKILTAGLSLNLLPSWNLGLYYSQGELKSEHRATSSSYTTDHQIYRIGTTFLF